jgi:DNA-binding CsgD family transcriptional regulator
VIPALSEREFDVMVLLAKGRTYHDTAHRLGISRATVNRHRQKVAEKTGAGSTIEALRILGWLRVPER